MLWKNLLITVAVFTLAGCAVEAPSETADHLTAELSVENDPAELGRAMADLPARMTRLPHALGCEAGCQGERQCILACIRVDEPRLRAASNVADCLFCGRETGFGIAPDLSVEVVDKLVALSWTAVENADFYTVHGVQWSGSVASQSFSWQTSSTDMDVDLAPNHRYTFYVHAWIDEPRERSEASNVVAVEL